MATTSLLPVHQRLFQIFDSMHDFVHDTRGEGINQVHIRRVFEKSVALAGGPGGIPFDFMKLLEYIPAEFHLDFTDIMGRDVLQASKDFGFDDDGPWPTKLCDKVWSMTLPTMHHSLVIDMYEKTIKSLRNRFNSAQPLFDADKRPTKKVILQGATDEVKCIWKSLHIWQRQAQRYDYALTLASQLADSRQRELQAAVAKQGFLSALNYMTSQPMVPEHLKPLDGLVAGGDIYVNYVDLPTKSAGDLVEKFDRENLSGAYKRIDIYFPFGECKTHCETFTIKEIGPMRFDKSDGTYFREAKLVNVNDSVESSRLLYEDDMYVADSSLYLREGVWSGSDFTAHNDKVNNYEGYTVVNNMIADKIGFFRIKFLWGWDDKETILFDKSFINVKERIGYVDGKFVINVPWYDHKGNFEYDSDLRSMLNVHDGNLEISYDYVTKAGNPKRKTYVCEKSHNGQLLRLDLRMYGVTAPGGWVIEGDDFGIGEARLSTPSFNTQAISFLESLLGIKEHDAISYFSRNIHRDTDKLVEPGVNKISESIWKKDVMKFFVPKSKLDTYLAEIKTRLFKTSAMLLDTDYQPISKHFQKVLTVSTLWDSALTSDHVIKRFEDKIERISMADLLALELPRNPNEKLYILTDNMIRGNPATEYIFFGNDVEFDVNINGGKDEDGELVNDSYYSDGVKGPLIPVKGRRDIPVKNPEKYILRTVALLKNALLDNYVPEREYAVRTRSQARQPGVESWRSIYPSSLAFNKKDVVDLKKRKACNSVSENESKRERLIFSIKNSGDAFQVASAKQMMVKGCEVVLLTVDELCFYNAKANMVPAILYKIRNNMVHLTVYKPHQYNGVVPDAMQTGGSGGGDYIPLMKAIKPLDLNHFVKILQAIRLYQSQVYFDKIRNTGSIVKLGDADFDVFNGLWGSDEVPFDLDNVATIKSELLDLIPDLTTAELFTIDVDAFVARHDVSEGMNDKVNNFIAQIRRLGFNYLDILKGFNYVPRTSWCSLNMFKYCVLFNFFHRDVNSDSKPDLVTLQNKKDDEKPVEFQNDEFNNSDCEVCLEYFYTKYPETFVKYVGIENIKNLLMKSHDVNLIEQLDTNVKYVARHERRNSDDGTGPSPSSGRGGGYRYINKNTQRKLSKYLLTRFMFQRRKMKNKK